MSVFLNAESADTTKAIFAGLLYENGLSEIKIKEFIELPENLSCVLYMYYGLSRLTKGGTPPRPRPA